MKIGKTFIWLTTVYSFTPSLVFLPQYFLHIMYLSMFLARGERRGRCGAFDQTCRPENGEFDWKIRPHGRAI